MPLKRAKLLNPKACSCSPPAIHAHKFRNILFFVFFPIRGLGSMVGLKLFIIKFFYYFMIFFA